MSKIDLAQLQPEQLVELRATTESEIQHFTQLLHALQTAQAKLNECVATIANMELAQLDDLLVPMTGSLYLPGKRKAKDQYLVDIGTGYFVEKTALEATKVYEGKLAKLAENATKLRDILGQKNNVMNSINMALRSKLASEEAAK